MSDALVVGLKTAAMFLVITVGYFCRRRGMIDAQSTSVMSRICTDIMLPPLIFMQMVETVDLATLRVGWVIPLLASAGICLGFAIGWASWRMFANRQQAPVFIFTSGISNWVYLPLPIVSALYGKEGIQTLFLCNLGLQILFWTVGVAILHGGRLDSKAIKHLATNPGLIATVGGIAFTVIRGLTGHAFADFASYQPARSAVEIAADGMRLLGQATIPVSLIVTGAQIAAATMVQSRRTRPLLGIIINRLAITPILCILLLSVFAKFFPVLQPSQLMVIALILIMPVSVTSTVLTEKMNQDTALAAQAVLYTTLISILTVPPIFMLAKALLG